MDLNIINNLFDVGKGLIERIWPDPEKRAEQLLKLEQLKQSGELEKLSNEVKLLTMQAEINKIDAQSSSKFQSWWRPSIGWVGAISLALMYIPKALVMTYIWTYQSLVILSAWEGKESLNIPAFPNLGVTDIIGLLISMLGVGVMRSHDKLKGIDTK